MTFREAMSTFRGYRLPHIDFIGRRRWWFAISGFFIVLALVGFFVRGLNFSIAFKGGAQISYVAKNVPSVADVQSILGRYGLEQDSQVEIVGGNTVVVQTKSLTSLGTRADQLRQDLASQAGISANQINETDVGPTWGRVISLKALEGLIIFLVLVSLYISFRFEPKMAGAALIALAHDLLITAGIYVLVGRQVTPESVIAILTILGYSLYDTVVIFDKIKENTDNAGLVARETYSGVVNISLNQTFMRSVNTSLVVLLPIGALLLFGGTTLKDFAFALFVGVASGTYSSIFIAAPVLCEFKEREPRYQQIRTRAAVRATKPARPAAVVSAGAGRAADDGDQVPATAMAGGGQTAKAPAARSTSAARKKKGRPQGKPKRRRR